MTKRQMKSKRRGRSAGGDREVSCMEIFKYIAALLLLIYVVLLLIYAGGSTRAYDEVAEKIEAGIQTDRMVKQNTQALKRFYGLNNADYEGAVLYMSKDSISAEEILLVKAKDDRQVQEIKDAVRTRIESRKDSFESVAPEQVQLLDKAQMLVRGKFVFLVVSKDRQEYVDLFTGSL